MKFGRAGHSALSADGKLVFDAATIQHPSRRQSLGQANEIDRSIAHCPPDGLPDEARCLQVFGVERCNMFGLADVAELVSPMTEWNKCDEQPGKQKKRRRLERSEPGIPAEVAECRELTHYGWLGHGKARVHKLAGSV